MIEMTIKVRYPEGPFVHGMQLFGFIETRLKEHIMWPELELEKPEFHRL